MVKNSRQKSIIKQLLRSRTDHPTAAMLFQDVQKEIPDISLATVYRNLRQMQERGEIQLIHVGDESLHYDGNVEPHYHHLCTRCGAVSDVMLPPMEDLLAQARAHTECSIENYELLFRGVCRDCANQERS